MFFSFKSLNSDLNNNLSNQFSPKPGILRSNRRPPSLFPSRPFSPSDPRLKYVIPEENFDPLIHFGLVCGAKSCPPIRVFSGEGVDRGLRWAAEGFCQEEISINAEKKKVKMSMLFKWYASDFGQNDAEIINFVRQFLPKDSPLRPNFKVLNLFTFSQSFPLFLSLSLE